MEKKRDRPATEEVTREMISAGVSALEFWRLAALDDLLVTEIYKAMNGANLLRDFRPIVSSTQEGCSDD